MCQTKRPRVKKSPSTQGHLNLIYFSTLKRLEQFSLLVEYKINVFYISYKGQKRDPDSGQYVSEDPEDAKKLKKNVNIFYLY